MPLCLLTISEREAYNTYNYMNNVVSAEIQAKAAAMFVNFSRLLGEDVLDADRKFLGKVWDISAKTI